MDIEKVIKGLEHCKKYGSLGGNDCNGHYEYADNLQEIIKANNHRKDCPYGQCRTGCVVTLVADALALLKNQNGLMLALEQSNAVNEFLNAEVERLNGLLKEQEAIKPRVSSAEQRCGNCNKVIEMDGWKVCPWCGKPILWEAVGREVK